MLMSTCKRYFLPALRYNADMRIDLHSHTTCSDGRLTPQELVLRATNMQLDVLAITDHDTMAALPQAQAYIEQQGLKLKIIQGVEISTEWQNREIHIVGLGVSETPQMATFLAEQREKRRERARKIAEKLEKAGVTGIYEEALSLAGGDTISRAHFAKVMLDKGVVTKMQQAFDKYLGKGKKAYAKADWLEMKVAIALIKEAGGIAVLAHPSRYDLSAKWVRRLVKAFADDGGQAIEVALTQQQKTEREFLASLCQEHDLMASMGSDFHYPTPWLELGRNLFLPEECKPVWSSLLSQ